jgi:hypothetical protein
MSAKHVELLTAPVGAPYLFYDVRPLFSGGGVPFTVQELANDLKRVGHSHIQKVRVLGCDKSGRWARRAGTSKIAPVNSALMSRHLSHICTERKGWHRSSTLCSAVTFPLRRGARPLEDNCGTLAERQLHPLQFAIGRLLLRGPNSEAERHALSATVSLPMSNVNFRLALPPLRNVSATGILGGQC